MDDVPADDGPVLTVKIARTIILGFIAAVASCTNYSSRPQTVNPPILLGIVKEGSGHVITIAAQNVEVGFLGYRVYTGATEAASRDAAVSAGIDCPPVIVPNQAVEYTVEVKPNQATVTSGVTNRLCLAQTSVAAGQYVTMRALLFRDFTSLDSSISSNALVAP